MVEARDTTNILDFGYDGIDSMENQLSCPNGTK
jgi:hypothetical protein